MTKKGAGKTGIRGPGRADTAIECPLQPALGISKIELNGAAPSSQLIYFHISAASARIARLLHIEEGDPLVMIKRLRLADGQPLHRNQLLTSSPCRGFER
ncbi:UTRA domain-containing protein [Enterobacter asburiae]|nr:UTRA domain-containing protein [Enterobacter asburiae]